MQRKPGPAMIGDRIELKRQDKTRQDKTRKDKNREEGA